ncbi:metal-dependent hydrolase [Arhodomonas sp. SL1]|uniref:metal-dependent hydrolase n=1 Tax=Arhodomonas sp. SL1 TaxID=3425691 RepID=UPI003F88276E
MDSLTQMALGAAVGAAVMGRHAGWRAFAWGGAVGTLPDLDVILDYGDAVANFTYHRGFSHAVALLLVAAVALAAMADRLHEDRCGRRPYRWLLAMVAVLVTHVALDALTIYGTQLWQPFSDYPVGLGSIFIIDPLYTLPLLAGLVLAVWALPRRGWAAAARWNAVGLALSSAYLVWSVAAQQHVEDVARRALDTQGVSYQRMLVTPTAFNTVLWRVLVVDRDGYYEGYHRIGQAPEALRLRHYPSDPSLLDDIAEQWSVRRLQGFTKGFYAVREEGGAVVITDLRMGQTPYFAFRFEVGRRQGETVRPVASRRREEARPPLSVALSELLGCARGEATQVLVC